MPTKTISFGSIAILYALGCAGPIAGARPGEMSMQQHRSTAAGHAQAGDEHAAQYDEKAMTDPGDCFQYLGSCWGSNPTEAHEKEATQHRRVAAAHRSGAQSLQEAEARACVGVSDADRDISPFLHREAIVDVKPLSRRTTSYGYERSVEEDVGATVVLLPAAGVTAERLQRIVECHVARNGALGNDVPGMDFCPLVPKGITASVTSAGNGFAVNIATNDSATAADVLRRARALLPR